MAKHKSYTKQDKKHLPLKQKIISATASAKMTYWLIALVSILPLLISNSTMDPTIAVRYIFLSLFILLFLIVFIVSKVSFSFIQASPIKYVFAAGVCYGIWSVISMVSATNTSVALYETSRHFLNMILLFLITAVVHKEPYSVIKLCKALLIISFIQSIIGILQFYGLAFMDLPGANPKPYGLMGNRTLFGSAQVLLMPFVIAVMYKAGKWWRIFSIVSLLLATFTIIISETRSAWFSFIIFFLSVFALSLLFYKKERKKLMIGSLLFVGTAIVVFFIWKANENDFTRSLNWRIGEVIDWNSNNNSSISRRLTGWNKTIGMIKANPLTGVGPGNWKIAVSAYGTEGTQWEDGLTLPSRPHNIYLEQAAETGLPGAILYFGIWALIVFAGIRLLIKAPSNTIKFMVIAMLSGIAAFATDGMFSFPTERIEHSLYFILMAGIILGLFSASQNNLAKNNQEKHWVIFSIFMLIAGLNLLIGFSKYNFEVHTMRAMAYQNENNSRDVLNEVESGKSIWVTIDPNGEPIQTYSAKAYLAMNKYNDALKEITTAKNYFPTSARIYATMGEVYFKLNQNENAITAYLKALLLTPRYEVAVKGLAEIYFANGNYKGCIETLKRIDISDNPYLAKLFTEAQKRNDH